MPRISENRLYMWYKEDVTLKNSAFPESQKHNFTYPMHPSKEVSKIMVSFYLIIWLPEGNSRVKVTHASEDDSLL
jgi:hypothetical protein